MDRPSIDPGSRDVIAGPGFLGFTEPLPLEELARCAALAERMGQWSTAADLYSRITHAALRAGLLEASVDALRGRGRILRNEGRYDEAAEMVELSVAIAERHGLTRAVARAVNVLAMIYYSQGDWEEATRLYEQALEMALDLGDDELIGLTCQNLGVLANLQGRLREARVRYLESIGSSVRSQNKRNELMAYNNLGIVCMDLQEWMEAEIYFSRGIEIAERINDSAQLARLSMNRADSLICVGELARAREALDRAQAIGTRIQDREVLAETACLRGVLARTEGDYQMADQHLTHSLTLAVEASLELERGGALREIGVLRRMQGKVGQAYTALHQAREIFAGLGAEREVRRIDELLTSVAEPAESM